MVGSLQSRAEELTSEFAESATTIGELNQLMRVMMKSGLERMLNTEMDVHLGRRGSVQEDTVGRTNRFALTESKTTSLPALLPGVWRRVMASLIAATVPAHSGTRRSTPDLPRGYRSHRPSRSKWANVMFAMSVLPNPALMPK